MATARAKKTTSGETATTTKSTFREADRHMYGGDIAGILSRVRADGTMVDPSLRPINDDNPMNLHRGDIVYLPEPTADIHFAWVHYDKTSAQCAADIVRKLSNGFRWADAKDFSVCPEKREFIIKNKAGRLTFMGLDEKAEALMWMPRKKWEENEAKNRRPADDIAKSAEQLLKEREEATRRSDNLYRYIDTKLTVEDASEVRFVPDEK